MGNNLFFILFFIIPPIDSCQIDFKPVQSADLLPITPTLQIQEVFEYDEKVIQRYYNQLLDTTFALVRTKQQVGFEDRLFAESAVQVALRIKANKTIK